MADRYDNSFSRRPQSADGNAGRRNEQASEAEDDPLVELARIVSGKSSFDDIVGNRPAMAAPTIRPAQTSNARDTSFDLESELMNDLQSSFDPSARSASGRPAQVEPQPPRASATRDPGFDHMGLRPGAPAAPPQWQPVQPPRPAAPRYQAEPRQPVEPRPRQDAYAPQPGYEEEDPYAGTAYAAAAEQGRDPVSPTYAGGYYSGQENGGDDRSTGYDDDYGDDPNGYDDDGYDDPQGYGNGDYEEPRRSRKGLIIAAAGLAIVLVGGLGALALKGGGGSDGGAPRVIAADDGPTKVQPAAQPAETEAAQNKLIYDRASPELAGDEQLVLPDDGPIDERPPTNESEASREISRIILPGAPGASGDPQSIEDLAGPAAPVPATDLDSGPRKVRTVVVKPDGTIISSEAAPRGGAAVADNAPAQQPAASAPDADVPAQQPEPIAPEPEPEAQQARAPEPAPAPAAPARPRAEQTAAAPAPAAPRAAAPASGGFVVQVSSQRSEEQAATAYRNMQRKFPNILGGQEPNIMRADLGAKGVYYRARVGPMATRDQAVSLCESLRAAGGDCIVQKN